MKRIYSPKTIGALFICPKQVVISNRISASVPIISVSAHLPGRSDLLHAEVGSSSGHPYPCPTLGFLLRKEESGGWERGASALRMARGSGGSERRRAWNRRGWRSRGRCYKREGVGWPPGPEAQWGWERSTGPAWLDLVCPHWLGRDREHKTNQ